MGESSTLGVLASTESTAHTLILFKAKWNHHQGMGEVPCSSGGAAGGWGRGRASYKQAGGYGRFQRCCFRG